VEVAGSAQLLEHGRCMVRLARRVPSGSHRRRRDWVDPPLSRRGHASTRPRRPMTSRMSPPSAPHPRPEGRLGTDLHIDRARKEELGLTSLTVRGRGRLSRAGGPLNAVEEGRGLLFRRQSQESGRAGDRMGQGFGAAGTGTPSLGEAARWVSFPRSKLVHPSVGLPEARPASSPRAAGGLD
jgi:hypothetical protein